jgi:hypothetical protein
MYPDPSKYPIATPTLGLLSGLVAVLAFAIRSHAQSDTGSIRLDASQYVVLVPDTDMNVFKEPTTAVATTPEMIIAAEKILRQFHSLLLRADEATLDSIASTFSRGSTAMWFGRVALTASFRQYASARTNDGAILLYVNGLPDDDERFPERRTKWVFVKDGGPRYFKARVNLTKHTIEMLWVNGR